jgi:tetratricopeptide (TPR) repeat protein
VALDPEKGLYRNNVATVLAEFGRADEALTHLKATNTESVALYNLGCLLQQRGQLQAAAKYFSQAAAIDPSFDEARKWAEKLSATWPGQSGTAYQDAVAAVQTAPDLRPEYGLTPVEQPYQAR